MVLPSSGVVAAPKSTPHEPLQDSRLIQRLLHARVGQVEPLLHEISPKHNLKPHRTTSIARLHVVRTAQRKPTRPRNQKFHRIDRPPQAALRAIPLKPLLTRKCPLPHRSSLLTIRLINPPGDAELVERLPSLIKGAEGNNVSFQVGRSATIGTLTPLRAIFLRA